MESSNEKDLEKIKAQFDSDIVGVTTKEFLREIEIKYLGKKGHIVALMQDLRHASPEQKPLLGKKINLLKQEISASIDNTKGILSKREMNDRLQNDKVDVTLPGNKTFLGRKHPISQMVDEVLDILVSMGFSVQYSPEVESEYYNYGGLNYPEDHPARDMQDTFYIDKETLLRSHTTSIQQRMMESHKPPIRVASPGKCYRNETITARSHVFFYQVDAFYIDKGVTFADLLATKKAFYEKIFNQKIEMRVRPSYFPFVEPGMEIDIKCTNCAGKGCALCKTTGWLEVCGAGMMHPEVIKAGGLDPDVYSGYAWGGGIERLFMLRHRISDIRLFTENNMNFLEQFG